MLMAEWPLDDEVVVLTERQLISRLLYPNPVCLLCTPGTKEAGEQLNHPPPLTRQIQTCVRSNGQNPL